MSLQEEQNCDDNNPDYGDYWLQKYIDSLRIIVDSVPQELQFIFPRKKEKLCLPLMIFQSVLKIYYHIDSVDLKIKFVLLVCKMQKFDGEVQKDDRNLKKQIKWKNSSFVEIGQQTNTEGTALSDLCNVKVNEFCTRSEIDLGKAVIFKSCQEKCEEMNIHPEFEKMDNILVNGNSKSIDDSVSVAGGDDITVEFSEMRSLKIGDDK